ncbi:hypothetical protein WJX81_000806 [Elliptochloris bilobata]|uniref:Uncharacterized protein n=1 Tax=Elliptochloris bilobata TaxID=381761 RepID=A0AAW1RG78_9CHLO
MNTEGVCIVTAANSGIGKEVAAGLLERGQHVILACRNMGRCRAAQEELAERRLPGISECAQLDVASYKSVRDFAGRVCTDAGQRGGRKVKVLINNAGIMGLPLTREGVDPHMHVNHYGPYLLMRLLLPALAPHARVVFVASRAHEHGRLHVSKGRVQGMPPHWYLRYARSKLCNVLTAAELQRRARAAGLALTTASVSPGIVATNLWDNLPVFWRAPVRLLVRRFCLTPRQGAATVLYAATEPGLERHGGRYWHACKEKRPSAYARDAHLAAKLWDASEAAVGLTKEEAAWP